MDDLELNGGLPILEQTPYVVFATPTLTSSLSLEFFRSYLDTEATLGAADIRFGCLQVAGDQFIANARNRIATEFLDDVEAATDLFFIDDDTGWPPDAALRFMLSEEEVIAGVCPQKSDTLSFPVELDFTNEKLTQKDGLFLAKRVGLAFLRMKRRVVAELAAKATRYPDPQGSGKMLYNIFETGINSDDGKFEGEDFAFCDKWRKQGGKIWVDPNVTFSHSGRKRWSGCLAGTLAQFMANIQAQEAAKAGVA